jgi:TM2 domain-containing membrane protein YozV
MWTISTEEIKMAKHDNCYWHEDRPAVGYCAFCGRPVCDESHKASFCSLCIEEHPKRKSTALLLAVLFGWLGVHRYYMGFYVTGVLYTLTLGIFGIGWAIDVIRILFWSTISAKKQPYFVGDHPPYCTVGIKKPKESTGSFVGALAGSMGEACVDGLSSDTRWFFDRRFWRDKDRRPLLRFGLKHLT